MFVVTWTNVVPWNVQFWNRALSPTGIWQLTNVMFLNTGRLYVACQDADPYGVCSFAVPPFASAAARTAFLMTVAVLLAAPAPAPVRAAKPLVSKLAGFRSNNWFGVTP